MTLFNELNEKNFLIYVAKHYYNPKCIDVDEFHEDLNRFKYIKRLINKYIESGRCSERLILNHLVVVFNSFGPEATLKILEYKMTSAHWPVLKPFLLFLNYIGPNQYLGIEMDKEIVERLRAI